MRIGGAIGSRGLIYRESEFPNPVLAYSIRSASGLEMISQVRFHIGSVLVGGRRNKIVGKYNRDVLSECGGGGGGIISICIIASFPGREFTFGFLGSISRSGG